MEVVIVGGGAAGLSAALVLGRARRRVVVVDAGMPRNASSPLAHSCFTRDGTPPAELLEIAREQLAPYDSVTLRSGSVTALSAEGSSFVIGMGDGSEIAARRVLLAVGVRDILPEIPGFEELWGRGALHCPYCHGWEVRDEPLACYATGTEALDLVPLLLQWSRDLILCTGGGDLSSSEEATIAALGVRIVRTPIERLEGERFLERIVFADGSIETRSAVFLRPGQVVASNLHRAIGCEETPQGLIQVGADQQTSVPRIYAAGDATAPAQQIIIAAASGALAAMMINRDLIRAAG